MRQPLVAGNWKMNGTRTSVAELCEALLSETFRCQVAICPPSIFLETVFRLIENSSIELGAQNLDWHESGAFTGELSGRMLAEFGCKYSLVGHSERRTLFGETDRDVAAKFTACQKAGLKPVLCVGETLDERASHRTTEVVTAQLNAVIREVGITALSNAVIAYEPVWAIGTGETATPEQAAEVHRTIRSTIAELDMNIAENIQILYGGSVNEENAAGLFDKPDIDGALVGGASLKAAAFTAICRAAERRL